MPAGARVADLGSDHGRLILALVETGTAAFAVATEATPERTSRLADSLGRRRRGPAIEARCGDGLAALRPADRLDCVVVAGIGGPAMARILSSPARLELGIRRFVLQPATDPGTVRRWLAGSGLGVVDEALVVERRRFHLVIVAEPGAPEAAAHPVLGPDDLMEVGPRLAESGDPVVIDYWRSELARARAILTTATPGRGRAEAEGRRALALRVLAALAPRHRGLL